MSEYWKSTPKYWCKFCQTYVRDTKLERANHESTGRHQGAIQRSLKNLHRDHEREEREKQRAKDEVARLKGDRPSASGASGAPWKKATISGASSAPAKPASLEERKRQMQQLADMGVAIPDEYRGDMAMAGEWKTVSETRVVNGSEDFKAEGDAKSIGVRKRKLEGGDEDEDESSFVPKQPKAWGSAFKAFPGAKGEEDDFDALLSRQSASTTKQESEVKVEDVVDTEDAAPAQGHVDSAELAEDSKDEDVPGNIKSEADVTIKAEYGIQTESDATPKPAESAAGVIFKKRKKKA